MLPQHCEETNKQRWDKWKIVIERRGKKNVKIRNLWSLENIFLVFPSPDEMFSEPLIFIVSLAMEFVCKLCYFVRQRKTFWPRLPHFSASWPKLERSPHASAIGRRKKSNELIYSNELIVFWGLSLRIEWNKMLILVIITWGRLPANQSESLKIEKIIEN